MISTRHNRLRKHSGFTLVEATIALLVLSIGLLGISALFFEGLRSGRTAVYRTTAVYLAGDMADRIRSNPLGGAAYENAAADNGCIAAAANCLPDELAEQDKLTWEADLATHMPVGTIGNITVVNNGATTLYTVNLSWPEPGFNAPLTYSAVVEL